MKFKTRGYDDLRGITIKCATHPEDTLTVEERADGKKGLFVCSNGPGVYLSRAKAIKFARAILYELDPTY